MLVRCWSLPLDKWLGQNGGNCGGARQVDAGTWRVTRCRQTGLDAVGHGTRRLLRKHKFADLGVHREHEAIKLCHGQGKSTFLETVMYFCILRSDNFDCHQTPSTQIRLCKCAVAAPRISQQRSSWEDEAGGPVAIYIAARLSKVKSLVL